jgi:hypothetical protein
LTCVQREGPGLVGRPVMCADNDRGFGLPEVITQPIPAIVWQWYSVKGFQNEKAKCNRRCGTQGSVDAVE